MRDINIMGRTVEMIVSGVVNDKNFTLAYVSVHTIHAPQSKIWKFDIALKKMSPFRLFSTLDVCVSYNKNEHFPSAT